jgi:phosphatidate cytidylyltransferase
LARRISPPRWRSTAEGNAVSGRALAETKSRWSDLAIRVTSALTLLPVVLACVWNGGIPFLILVALGCYVACVEWFGMWGVKLTWLRYSASMLLTLSVVLANEGHAGDGLVVLAVAMPITAFLSRRAVVDAGRRPFDLALGLLYFGVAAVSLIWLRADAIAGWPNVLFVLCIVWGSDIGAYVIGRLVGGPKLAPSISPGKTWSGAGGGLVGAALAAAAVASWTGVSFSPPYVIGLAVALGVIAQLGDLLESALKRHFGVKDSGHLIPGHGGLLDRVDALLAVAPLAALLALHAGRGVVIWR